MKLFPRLSPEVGPGAGSLAIARLCMLALAFVLPFSIALTEAALITGLVALAVSRARGRRFRFKNSWLEPASLALLASWLLATAFSAERADSLFHVRKLYALGLIWLAAETCREPAMRRRIVPLLLAGAGLTAVAGLLIYAARIGQEPGYRLQSLLSNQMTSGGVLAAAALWGLGYMSAAAGRRRWAVAATLLPLGGALVLTQTRSHWLGFTVGAAVVLLSLAPRRAWLLPALAGAVWLISPARIAARFLSIFDPHEPGNQGRLSMWRSARDIIRAHPALGVGCQDLLALYRRFKYPDATFESGHFHNNFIQVAVMAGVVGVAAFAFWHAAALRQLWRARRSATGEDRGLAASGMAVFAAMMVGGMFDFTFGDAEVVYHSYLALGLALAILAPRAARDAADGSSA